MTIPAIERNPKVEAIIKAWRALYPDEEKNRRGDAGARARLRRAASPADVELEPAFHDFLRRMNADGSDFEAHRFRRVAMIAGLLAGRKTDRSSGKRLMRMLGKQQDTSDYVLKPLRFQVLIGALDRGDETEIMTTLRRALLMARDEEVNLYAFVEDILYWGEKARRRWTYDYFGHPFESSSSETNAISTEETAA